MAAPWQVVWDTVTAAGLQLEESATVGQYLGFIGFALAFGGAGFGTAALLRKRSGYSGGSGIAYESGEDPIGTPWVAFQARYYVVALLFLLFEVEIAFMFPYALALEGPNAVLAFLEGSAFVVVLGLGLVFAWAGGWLDWPGAIAATVKPWEGVVPKEAYRNVYRAGKTDLK